MITQNMKFLRTYSGLSQSEFALKFKITRGMVDSYERGKAKPSIQTLTAIANYYSLSLEIMQSRNLQKNPGLLFASETVNKVLNNKESDLVKAKEETIKELRQHNKYLQGQIELLNEAIKSKKE